MKIGVHFGALGDMSFEEGFPALAECGAEGAEIVLREGTKFSINASSADLRGIRNLSARCGLPVMSVSNAYLWKYPLTSDDPDIRREGLQSLLAQIRIASELEAKTLLVIAGYVGLDSCKKSGVVRYDIAVERAREGIASAVSAAERLGVTMCLENVWNRMLLSPVEARDFIDSFHSRSVAQYLDVGNCMLYGYPEQWAAILGSRVCAVHMKDYSAKAPLEVPFVPLLRGDVDFPAVMRELRKSEYGGYLTLELHTERCIETVRRELATLRGMMSA